MIATSRDDIKQLLRDIKKSENLKSKKDALDFAIIALDELHAIDPESLRPQGEWIKQKRRSSWDCSICGHTVGAYIAGCANYCSNCGARMKGAGEDE